MKTKHWTGIFLLGVCLSLPSHAQQTRRTSGWYHLYASPTDSIGQTPIVTLKDCAALELNPAPYGHYTIIGQVKEHLLEHWADETEKAIGQRIAFVWNDSILTAPRVNARITGGRFQISSRHSERNRSSSSVPAPSRVRYQTSGSGVSSPSSAGSPKWANTMFFSDRNK